MFTAGDEYVHTESRLSLPLVGRGKNKVIIDGEEEWPHHFGVRSHSEDEIENSRLTEKFHIDFKAKPVMDKKRAEHLLGNGFLLQKIQDEIKKDSSFFLVVEKTPLERVDEI